MTSSFKPATREASYARIALSGPSGSGKAQPIDAPILTPSGWRNIGDLVVGDAIYAADGSVTTVVGVYPQGVQPIYRLTFTDGSAAESTYDHLWLTQTVLDRAAKRPGSVKTLSEIAGSLLDRHGKRNHWVPIVSPMDFPESGIVLDPWLLGVIIGDGCLRGKGVTVANSDARIRDAIREALPGGGR